MIGKDAYEMKELGPNAEAILVFVAAWRTDLATRLALLEVKAMVSPEGAVTLKSSM